MATQPIISPSAAPGCRPSTRRSWINKPMVNASSRPQACASPRSADLAGRSVRISGDVPALFDEPLGAHHRAIGQWVATREKTARRYTRPQARRRIERAFDAAVRDILRDVTIADLLTIVFVGDEGRPPALGIICQSMGQIDLGWIEDGDAPIGWRAAAYKALGGTLGSVLPIFGYADLFEEVSAWYWDHETDDEAARQNLIDMHGADPADLDDYVLPSTMNARRPDWMIAGKAARPSRLPAALRQAIATLREAHRQVKRSLDEGGAWSFDFEAFCEYDSDYEDRATLPPLTLVPFEIFARELDDVGRAGMELGFIDIAGLCPLSDPQALDRWFASLRIGADLLLAAQALIQLDPTKPGATHD